MSLSDIKIRSLKPRETLYKKSDGEGLYIEVKPTGTKSWRLTYRYDGKQKTITLGRYPTLTLKGARDARDRAKELLARGEDPIAAKKAVPIEETGTGETFEQVADRWFRANEKRWVSGYAARLRNRLVEDVYPTLGQKGIADIKPRDILATIRAVEERGAIEMGRRIHQMIGQVFQFAAGEELVEADPSQLIKSALAPLPPKKHRASLRPEQLPKLYRGVAEYEGDPVTIGAMRLVIHTFVRTSELRFAEWTEFEDLDGDGPLWRISPAKMKMRREHIVPLSRQAVGIIKGMKPITGNSQYLFPSPLHGKDKPISENTLIYCLYRMGYKSRASVHGFRSSASTYLNEKEWNRDWVELQLAHVDASIRGVYNSALYLTQRRKMMQAWSNFIDPPALFEDVLG